MSIAPLEYSRLEDLLSPLDQALFRSFGPQVLMALFC